ncbi:Unknown protein sequence [Pseudomonas syringae pv. solidagae]|nr:Unknown protein sequence [Pseudomonas syringae pv. solidagae]
MLIDASVQRCCRTLHPALMLRSEVVALMRRELMSESYTIRLDQLWEVKSL